MQFYFSVWIKKILNIPLFVQNINEYGLVSKELGKRNQFEFSNIFILTIRNKDSCAHSHHILSSKSISFNSLQKLDFLDCWCKPEYSYICVNLDL